MTLRDYLEKRQVTVRDFADMVGGPKFQAISRYANGLDTPGLEVALMICRATDGEVTLHDMLSRDKRKYTEDGDSICIMVMADSQPEEEEIIL